MADKFPGTLRDAAGNGLEQGFVESSGNHDAERPVRRDETFPIYGFAKLPGKAAQDAEFGIASPESRAGQKPRRSQRQTRSEGVAESANPAGSGCAEQRPQNLGKQMGVFVSVDVRNGDSSRLNLANLCGGFGGDFLGIDAASDRARRKSEQPMAKAGVAGKRGKLLRAKNRPAIDQNH